MTKLKDVVQVTARLNDIERSVEYLTELSRHSETSIACLRGVIDALRKAEAEGIASHPLYKDHFERTNRCLSGFLLDVSGRINRGEEFSCTSCSDSELAEAIRRSF
jgi:hypothetical protein